MPSATTGSAATGVKVPPSCTCSFSRRAGVAFDPGDVRAVLGKGDGDGAAEAPGWHR